MSKKLGLLSVAGLAVAAMSASAFATDVLEVSGSFIGAIPDSAGGVPGSISGTATLPANPFGYEIVGVSIQLRHSWIGDLQINLSGPGGAVSIINRPGFTGTGFGSSGDFSLNEMYMWVDDGAPFPTTLIGAQVVPSGNYAPEAGSFAALGTAAGGSVWTLSFADNAGGDTGFVESWALKVKKVPTPGALALFGVAGLAAARRRR